MSLKCGQLHCGGMSVKGREHIGKVLADVKADFNGSEKCRKAVQRAFQKTVLPGYPKNKRLQRKLDECQKNKWEPVYKPYPNPISELPLASLYLEPQLVALFGT